MHGERARNAGNWRGREYWSRRGMASYRRDAHADRQSFKRIVRRRERRTAKQSIGQE
jgi:hypothetical protein